MSQKHLSSRRAAEAGRQPKLSAAAKQHAGMPLLRRLQERADSCPTAQATQALQRKADGRVTQFGRKKGGKKGRSKGQTMSLADFNAMVAPPRREQYDALPAAGTIEPSEVRFSQDGCTFFFQNAFNDNEGTPITNIHEATEALEAGRLDPLGTPAITITFYQDEIVSVDNRRLKAHKDAGAIIRYNKVDFDNLTANQKAHFDGSAHDNLNVR